MKRIIIILTVGILISCSATKTGKESSEKFIFKSIYEASYSAKRSGEMTRENALKKTDKMEFYDKNGALTEYWQYETDGTIYTKTKLTKDENGKLLKSNTYDNVGNLKRYLETEFDNNGNIVFYRTYNPKNEPTSVQENKYDSNGNITMISSITLSSNRTFKTARKYNSKNQLIEETDFKPDGTIKDVRTFKYDDKGNEMEAELRRPNGEYTQFVSTYDERNNISTQHWFDKDGNQKHWNTWEYTYDKYDNWITRRRFSKGELGYVWERRIEYY